MAFNINRKAMKRSTLYVTVTILWCSYFYWSWTIFKGKYIWLSFYCFFFIIKNICVWVLCLHVCAQCSCLELRGPEDSTEFPGARFANGCEHHVCSVTRTQVLSTLWKTNTFSRVSVTTLTVILINCKLSTTREWLRQCWAGTATHGFPTETTASHISENKSLNLK